MENYIGEGTIFTFAGFDRDEDARRLRKAMEGFGTDEKAIINILAQRTNVQRQYIALSFKTLYGKDLIDELKRELCGQFEKVILALMMPFYDYLAQQLNYALSGFGTDEDALIDILCSGCTNTEILKICEAYKHLFEKSLEDVLSEDTSGHFRRLLISICQGARDESSFDSDKAKEDAQTLFEAGTKQWGTDESVFNSILVTQGFHQLRTVFHEYEKLAGESVYEAIDKEISGSLKKGMLAIVQSILYRPAYFAKRLHEALAGIGTVNKTLIRIVTSRCEIDMVQIKAEYEKLYEESLEDAIIDDTSGDYEKVLVALVVGNY